MKQPERIITMTAKIIEYPDPMEQLSQMHRARFIASSRYCSYKMILVIPALSFVGDFPFS
jgi:hypothetical protein